MHILPDASSALEIVDFVQARLRPMSGQLVGLATQLLLVMLQMVYMLRHDLEQLEPDMQEQVWQGLGIKPRDNWIYIDLLKYFHPAPDKSDPAARKRVQNQHSRYAKVLRLAENRGIKANAFASRIVKEGGMDAFVRRFDKPPRGPPAPSKRKATSDGGAVKPRTMPPAGTKLVHPEVTRDYEVRVKRKLRPQIPKLSGRHIAIVDADSVKGHATIRAIEHLHESATLRPDELLCEIVRFVSDL